MKLFIYACILVLNVVTMLLTYKFLGSELEKKDKIIAIAVGFALLYVMVTGVYWISTSGIELGEIAGTAQNLITFAFVPVNGLLILPFLAISYRQLKQGNLKKETFKKRCIILGVLLVILLLIEYFYFKDIQNGILSMIQARS